MVGTAGFEPATDGSLFHCSGGFPMKPWKIVFDQLLEVEMLESALKWDLR
ncbi:MAG: hypothetical protein ACW98Y_00465 [Candidatus Thorarchaeota archaeon]|jgi:hypothetical protein